MLVGWIWGWQCRYISVIGPLLWTRRKYLNTVVNTVPEMLSLENNSSMITHLNVIADHTAVVINLYLFGFVRGVCDY